MTGKTLILKFTSRGSLGEFPVDSLSGHHAAVPEISRGLSTSDTPGKPSQENLHPGGVPEP